MGVWYCVQNNDLDFRLAWLYAVHPMAVVEITEPFGWFGHCFDHLGYELRQVSTWCWFIASGVNFFLLCLWQWS